MSGVCEARRRTKHATTRKNRTFWETILGNYPLGLQIQLNYFSTSSTITFCWDHGAMPPFHIHAALSYLLNFSYCFLFAHTFSGLGSCFLVVHFSISAAASWVQPYQACGLPQKVKAKVQSSRSRYYWRLGNEHNNMGRSKPWCSKPTGIRTHSARDTASAAIPLRGLTNDVFVGRIRTHKWCPCWSNTWEHSTTLCRRLFVVNRRVVGPVLSKYIFVPCVLHE